MTLPSTEPFVLGETSLDRFDAVVIGSGAGGSAYAWMLAKNGRRVLMLEAGESFFPGLDDPAGLPPTLFSGDELKMRRHFISPDPIADPRSFRPDDASGDRTLVGDVNGLPKTVGGGAVHADMKFVRFQTTDFELGSRLAPMSGASFADWPIAYGDLAAFYTAAEDVTGVQGTDGTVPFLPPRGTPYPMPPGLPMYASTLTADAATRLGYEPFAYPTAVNSIAYRGRPACADCGLCSGYGCASHAKGSPAVTFLRDALLTGNVQLRFRAPALRLVPSSDGSRVDAVEYRAPDGTTARASGDVYVLAANAIEDARLCLLSDPGGPGLGNGSGLVGRNLLFHHQTYAIGIYRQRLHGHRGRALTHGMTDFRGVPGDAKRPLGGILELATSADLIAEANVYSGRLGFLGRKLEAFLRESPLRDRLGAVLMQGEDAPQPTNRVDLDPALVDWKGQPVARITYASHAFELAAREHYGPLMVDILREAGARFGFVAPPDEPPESRHVMGTLRMGGDPAESVCDRTGRFHDLDNLYCADGALFPTGSGLNPTLTIHALAMRVAGELVSPGTPESAIPAA